MFTLLKIKAGSKEFRGVPRQGDRFQRFPARDSADRTALDLGTAVEPLEPAGRREKCRGPRSGGTRGAVRT